MKKVKTLVAVNLYGGGDIGVEFHADDIQVSEALAVLTHSIYQTLLARGVARKLARDFVVTAFYTGLNAPTGGATIYSLEPPQK